MLGCIVSEGEKIIGEVIRIDNFGSSDILFVKTPKGNEVMVPLLKEFVTKIDVVNKKKCSENSSTCLKTYVIDTNNKLVLPEVITNDPVPVETEALIDPVAIWDKFKPVIPEAGIFINPDPSPVKDPVNEPVL